MNFPGFDIPSENWSKLPHSFIDYFPVITTIAEMKCVLYTLRHTWGFSAYGTGIRLSLDEYQNGRKRKNGTRFDNGTQLSIPAIRSGLQLAVEHGILFLEKDEQDKARVHHYYGLVMAPKDCIDEYFFRGPPEAEAETMLMALGVREAEVTTPIYKLILETLREVWTIKDSELENALVHFIIVTQMEIPRTKSIRSRWLKDIREHLEAYGLEECKRLWSAAFEAYYEKIASGDLTITAPGSLTSKMESIGPEVQPLYPRERLVSTLLANGELTVTEERGVEYYIHTATGEKAKVINHKGELYV